MNPMNPTSLVRHGRKITGITAKRLPLVDWGDIDWGPLNGGSFDRHLLRTDVAGRTSAINWEPFAGRMSIPQSVGLKHSSFRRKPEWQRLPPNVIPPSPPHGDTQNRDTA